MNLYYESSNELYHHGIKGMKWGRRRFQNSDGSLTAAGRKRYSGGGISGAIRNKQYSNAERDLASVKKQQRQVNSELRELKGYAKNPTGLANSKISTAIRNKQIRDLEKSKAQLKSREKDNRDAMRELDEIDKAQAQKRAAKEAARNTPEAQARREKTKKAIKIGAAVAGTALVAYGAYKVNKLVKDENTRIIVNKGKAEVKQMKAYRSYDRNQIERDHLRMWGGEDAPYPLSDKLKDFDNETSKMADKIMSRYEGESHANFKRSAKNVANYHKEFAADKMIDYAEKLRKKNF